jgi:PhnB protein
VKEQTMQLNPYLSFNGQCEAAFKFYAEVLGGKILATMTYGDTPMVDQTPADWRGKIAHTRMSVGGTLLMGSDSPPDRFEPMKGVTIALGVDDPAEAERVFHALAAGGAVTMPIQETFWARRFGMLTDRFGTPWMINCEKPM